MTGSNDCELFTSEVIPIDFVLWQSWLLLKTHFTALCFQNEAMTGSVSQNPVYSRITLALLQDTGWEYSIVILWSAFFCYDINETPLVTMSTSLFSFSCHHRFAISGKAFLFSILCLHNHIHESSTTSCITSPNKSCNLDPFPKKLFKTCLDNKLDSLNNPITNIIFSDDFKQARVNLLLKKLHCLKVV